MFIQTEETPNPATLKFLPGIDVMPEGTAEFTDETEAAASPLAESLFKIQGVSRVFFGPDFISVTKGDEMEWEQIKTPVLAAIMDHFTMGFPLFKEGQAPKDQKNEAKASDGMDGEISGQIIELLDTRVRPAVAQDGGDIEFQDYDEGIVYLRMRGACAGCPSSTMTLKMGIENMLKHFIPEVQEVRAIEI